MLNHVFMVSRTVGRIIAHSTLASAKVWPRPAVPLTNAYEAVLGTPSFHPAIAPFIWPFELGVKALRSLFLLLEICLNENIAPNCRIVTLRPWNIYFSIAGARKQHFFVGLGHVLVVGHSF